ncbi:MAG: DinB family protein [Acidobacteria bacterium]|nr:MAG: DinB family protein [Acidobacteriota bacterium]
MMPAIIGAPDRTEASEYYFKYIDRVSGADICEVLAGQRDDLLHVLRGVSDQQSRHRYAPGKWSIREVLGHINDAERLFVLRAWWFARGFDTPLPSFDQNVAAAAARADERAWKGLVDEFVGIRAGTLSFFGGLPAEAWMRRGQASGLEFTVRALAYIAAGRVIHHTEILRERYLNHEPESS